MIIEALQLIRSTEMVLFHSAFVASKARCPRTQEIKSEEYRLDGERKLFQGSVTTSFCRSSLLVLIRATLAKSWTTAFATPLQCSKIKSVKAFDCTLQCGMES